MPPINLYCLPSQDWFDKLLAKPHSRDTQNRVVKQSLATKKPHQFMKGR